MAVLPLNSRHQILTLWPRRVFGNGWRHTWNLIWYLAQMGFPLVFQYFLWNHSFCPYISFLWGVQQSFPSDHFGTYNSCFSRARHEKLEPSSLHLSRDWTAESVVCVCVCQALYQRVPHLLRLMSTNQFFAAFFHKLWIQLRLNS